MEPPRTRSIRREMPRDGFDFTLHVRRLCADMTCRVPELGHIDLEQVAVCFCQTRKNVSHGMFASLTPMRFDGGREVTTRRGRKWTVQRLFDAAGCEMLYILRFYLPRFLDLPFREKLTTVVHELWHVSPEFNGDLRRHRGRCYAHGSSQKQYDARVATIVDHWLSLAPPDSLSEFLRYGFAQLTQQRGPVYGLKIPTPKLIAVD